MDLQKNKGQKSMIAFFKEDVLFLGDLRTVDSNLIFFHSSLKLLNILVTYNKNLFLIFYENDFVSVLIVFLQKIVGVLTSITSEVKILSNSIYLINIFILYRKRNYKS